MRRIFAILFIACGCDKLPVVAATEASVKIIAVTPFGSILTPVTVVEFVNEKRRGENYGSRFHDSEARGIPYGRYFVRVRAEDRLIAASVRVQQESSLIVLSGPDQFVDPSPSSQVGLHGKILGLAGTGLTWIKMTSIYSAEDPCCQIVRVSPTGEFVPGLYEAGDYVLLVLHDGNVLFDGRVRLERASKTITVDLGLGTAEVRK